MGKQTDRYASASKAYQNALNKYAGEEGWKSGLGSSLSTYLSLYL